MRTTKDSEAHIHLNAARDGVDPQAFAELQQRVQQIEQFLMSLGDDPDGSDADDTDDEAAPATSPAPRNASGNPPATVNERAAFHHTTDRAMRFAQRQNAIHARFYAKLSGHK